MTPEERAVINAAIEWRRAIPGKYRDIKLTIDLERVIWELIIACPECNAGGHTCGCGDQIGHADSNCGDHDDDGPREDPLSGELIPAGQDAELDRQGREIAEDCSEHPGAEYHGACKNCIEAGKVPPRWYARTWMDVRAGDRVRLPGTEHVAAVESVVALPWHVHPAADSYRPNEKPAEWTEIKVRLAGRPGLLSMSPAAPIEIELTASELAAIELLGGWGNRERMITE